MRIQHGRVWLELHQFKGGGEPTLLLLHALYGSSAEWGEAAGIWPGGVCGLDFCGHGGSDWLVGGAYVPEILLADADVALSHIGRAAVAGAGVGSYVALLLAGARREQVPAALLLPGRGLKGGGPVPDFNAPPREFLTQAEPAQDTCDPGVRVLESDVRPVDYVEPFADAARRLLLLENGTAQPPWWEAVSRRRSAEQVRGGLVAGLRRLADAAM